MIYLNYTAEDGTPEQLEMDIEYNFDDNGQHAIHPEPCCSVYLYNTGDGLFKARGHAYLTPPDTFNKAVGRRIAFERAVNNFTSSRSIRQQLWKSYLSHRASETANPPKLR